MPCRRKRSSAPSTIPELMAYAILLIALALFMAAIHFTGMVSRVKGVIVTTHETVGIMRSTELDDEQKEAAVQKAAIAMMLSFVTILLRVIVICAVPTVFVYICLGAGLLTADALYAGLANWYFIVITSVIALAVLFVKQ